MSSKLLMAGCLGSHTTPWFSPPKAESTLLVSDTTGARVELICDLGADTYIMMLQAGKNSFPQLPKLNRFAIRKELLGHGSLPVETNVILRRIE